MEDPVFGTGGILKAEALDCFKSRSNSLILDPYIDFAGTVTVNDGNLEVDTRMGLASVVVNSGGTLSGYGSVGSLTVNQGGTVHPGIFSHGNYRPGVPQHRRFGHVQCRGHP